MTKALKCSVLHSREISIPKCEDDPAYCTRTYHLFLPDILCSGKARQRHLANIARYTSVDKDAYFEGEHHYVGTIPMVFVLHGLGRDYKTMAGFAQGADDYHFAMILPEGINTSFNADSCCGDAQALGIHDDHFLYYIQQEISEEFSFLQAQYSYGIGWDNGALLLNQALINHPHLFRAIVPISGLSGSWIPPSIGTGIGIMMHHSLDDTVMRPSGCCADSNMPTCQSDFIADECVSFLQSFDLWARGVNLCNSGKNENLHDATDPNTLLVGGDGDFLYSLFHKGGETSVELIPSIDGEGNDRSTILSRSEVSLSVTQQREEYICLTTTSPSCISTSTICIYKSMSHFDGFLSTPFMSNHVMKFLAQEACSINNGSWNQIRSRNKKVCGCAANGYNGVFCLDEGDANIVNKITSTPEQSLESAFENMNSPEASSPPNEQVSSFQRAGWSITLIGSLIMAAVSIVFILSWRKYRSRGGIVIDYEDSTKSATMLRGFNPYRDQFKVKTKGNDGICTQRRDSKRSLEPDDIEMLQMFRQNSKDSLPNSDMGNFDKELLQSYRRREQMKHQYPATPETTQRDPIEEHYLINEIPCLNDDKKYENKTQSSDDQFFNNVLWDKSML